MLKVAAQCMANLAAGGTHPAAAVWEAAFPAAWQRLLTVQAGAASTNTLLLMATRTCGYSSNACCSRHDNAARYLVKAGDCACDRTFVGDRGSDDRDLPPQPADDGRASALLAGRSRHSPRLDLCRGESATQQ